MKDRTTISKFQNSPNPDRIKKWTLLLLVFVGATLLYFLIVTAVNGYWIWNDELNFAVTGQFGDFVGGFLGTIINGAAFYLLYVTLNEQIKSSLKQSFETKLYELVHLHRENLSELRYSKYYKNKMETSESRKVFRVIAQEFLDCFHEVKRFSKMYPELNIILPAYRLKLEKIREDNGCKVSVEDLAFIDLAFCYFYFGVSKESAPILLHKFFYRYNKEFTHRLKIFLQLKPKKENVGLHSQWNDFKRKEVHEMRIVFDAIYQHVKRPVLYPLNNDYSILHSNLGVEKYYGGHQHRLGHYFRHLFQSFKFLSTQDFLNKEEKYFYGKTIRAQLSTYEQFLLFINSLSSLGMKWEYTAEFHTVEDKDDFKFITRYNLIKNLPGTQYYEFKYRKYYPNVKFEYLDDISYR